jgi:hypothetical protein
MKKLIALAALIFCYGLQATFAQENYPSSQHVFYIDPAGDVHELLYTSAQGRWTNQNLTALTGAPSSGVDNADIGLASFHDSFGIEVFYQSGGQIIELHWNGGWSWQALGGNPVANTPITGFSNSNGEHVYFVNTNDDVTEFYFNGSTWGLTALASTSGVHPVQLSSYADGSNTAHVFYNIGAVFELYYDGSSWHLTQLPGVAAVSAGVAGIWDNNGEEIFYTVPATLGNASTSAAYDYWSPVTRTWSSITLPGGPNSNSFATGFANSNGEHFYYFSQSPGQGYLHVMEDYFNYGTKSWAGYDTSVQTGAYANVGSTITSFSNSNGQHVYFINTNSSIGEFYYPTNGTHWAYSDILAQTSPPSLEPGVGAVALSSFSF